MTTASSTTAAAVPAIQAERRRWYLVWPKYRTPIGSHTTGRKKLGKPRTNAAATATTWSPAGPNKPGSPVVVTGTVELANRYPSPSAPTTAQHMTTRRHAGQEPRKKALANQHHDTTSQRTHPVSGTGTSALICRHELVPLSTAGLPGPDGSRRLRRGVRVHLAPCLGQVLLPELSAPHVQAMFTAIIRQHQALGTPVTAATLNRIRAAAGSADHRGPQRPDRRQSCQRCTIPAM
jgi:hypothetical protein